MLRRNTPRNDDVWSNKMKKSNKIKKLKAGILMSLPLDDLGDTSQINNSLANPTNLAVWPRRWRGWCCSNNLLLHLIS